MHHPTPGDALQTHSSLQSQEGKTQQPLGEIQGATTPGLSPMSHRMIAEGNPSQSLMPPIPSRTQFHCFHTPWAVLPAGRTSRCCQAPASVGKADPNTEPHTPNTICLPSLHRQRRRQPGTRQHRGRAIHTASSSNSNSAPSLAVQQSVPGGAGRALNTPCVTHEGHPHSTALGTKPARTHQAGDPGSWVDFPAGTHQANTS